MTAPALVALAHGSRDPRSAGTITALVDELRRTRPDLRIEPAFLDLCTPSFPTVVDRLVRAGYDEVVVVPLLLTEAYHAKVDVPEAVAAAAARHDGLRIRATAVLGLEAAFLEVLDQRLRAALSDARVRELDALVLAAAGSSDQLANQAVARLARLPTRPPPHRPPVRRCASSAPRAAGTSRSGRCSWPPACCPTGRRSWPWRRAPSRCPTRSGRTPSWPARCSPATPSGPSSSCRSDPARRLAAPTRCPSGAPPRRGAPVPGPGPP
jgi:hypothetical protein